jgi:uncharacterized oligopeptide transporter (OPT) family protein
MTNKDNYIFLTRGNVGKVISRMAIPTIAGMLVTSIYNLVDAYYVGQINTQATAAVGVAFPAMAIVQAIGFFFGQGSGTYISRQFVAFLDAESEVVANAYLVFSLRIALLVFALTAALIVTFVFFWIGVIGNLTQAIVAFFVVVVIAFLFTTVAANAIAIVGSNPVSGMTLMTLIVASTIFVAIGLNGTQGIIASMVIGGVVCTALSMAGGMVTDMKIGYWLGSTPAKQQTWKAVGTLVSAATVGGVILLLNKAYGFTNPDVMAAPQANAMAAVIDPLMMGGDTPWILYSVGAVFACLLNWLGVPALAFSLGMFIPFHLNAPLLVGGAISWFVGSRSKDEKLNKARQEKGTLLASGFIAGGALMGVVSAGMTLSGFSYECPLSDGVTSALAVVIYLALIGFLICSCLKAKKED